MIDSDVCSMKKWLEVDRFQWENIHQSFLDINAANSYKHSYIRKG